MITVLSEDQIAQDIITYLSTYTPINDFRDGSIAGAFVRAIAKQLAKQYQILDIYNRNAYLSTSSGIYLDALGELVNCARLPSESDDNYRYRIAHQIETMVGSNETAITLRCLAIDGVKSVKIVNYARGVGTFDVYIITDDPVTSPYTLSQAQTIIDQYSSLGVKGRALSPMPIPIELTIQVIANTPITSGLISIIRSNISNYLDTIDIGGKLIIDQLTKSILTADITEFNYIELKINSVTRLIENYSAPPTGRLYLKELTVL